MFKNQNPLSLTIIGLSLGYATYAVIESLKIHKEERMKRKKIQEEHLINLEAIHNASIVMNKRIMSGYYDGNLEQAMLDLDKEIEFEKLSILAKQ